MEETYWVLGLIIVIGAALFFFIEWKWRRISEEVKADRSQPMWTLMQQQMEQLRGQMNNGLSRDISLLTEQLRVINEQVNQQLQLVNQQLQNSSGQIGQRLDSAAKVIGEVRENRGTCPGDTDSTRGPGKRSEGFSRGLSIGGKTYHRCQESV